jgi:hypothetical protein
MNFHGYVFEAQMSLNLYGLVCQVFDVEFFVFHFENFLFIFILLANALNGLAASLTPRVSRSQHRFVPFRVILSARPYVASTSRKGDANSGSLGCGFIACSVFVQQSYARQ